MDDSTNAPLRRHQPVLTQEVCDLLAARRGDIVLDATVGLAGHASLLCEAAGPEGRLIGLDVDPANLAAARRNLEGAPCRIDLIKANFAEVPEVLRSLDLTQVDVLFADLGVSSPQLDDPARGFSFQRDGPLDMRLDPDLEATAADLVNRLKEKELGDLIYFNSQEHGARRIARRICEVRREGRITTTKRLADLVAGAVGARPDSRRQKIHPATRTFLALRIAVNRELGNLEALLEHAPDVLAPGARFGLIAFHSVEDKPIKNDFRRRKNERFYRILTKKPVTASPAERKANPRSRSAKLRVAQRLPVDQEA